MGVATIVNPSGTGPSPAVTNDQNIVNDMVLDLTSAQLSEQLTTFTVTQFFDHAQLQTKASGVNVSLLAKLGGGNNTDTTSGSAVPGIGVATTGFLNLITWKSWISCTLVEFRVQATEIITLGGSNTYDFQLYKGTNRTGASWTSMLTAGSTTSLDDGTPMISTIAVASVAVNDLLRVGLTENNTPECSFQVTMTFTTSSEAF